MIPDGVGPVWSLLYLLSYCTIHNIYIDCTWWSQNLAGCWYPGHGCNGTSWCRTTPHSKENSSASTRGIRGNSPGRGLQIKYGEFWSLQKYRSWIWQKLVIGCNRVYNSLGFQVVEPLGSWKKAIRLHAFLNLEQQSNSKSELLKHAVFLRYWHGFLWSFVGTSGSECGQLTVCCAPFGFIWK